MYSNNSSELQYLRILEDIRNYHLLSLEQICFIVHQEPCDFYTILKEFNRSIECLICDKQNLKKYVDTIPNESNR